MKVRKEMINKELRTTGFFMRFVPYFFSGLTLKVLSLLSKPQRKKVKSEVFNLSEHWITRNDGSKLRVCVYRPLKYVDKVPGFLWFHGGGYAIGSPEQTARVAELLISTRECVVVSPAYRLSLDAPYPAALEDCYDTLAWMKKNAQELGIRDDQIMVGGESAGGGLAVALTHYARDKGEIAIAFQMPLYPMIDDRMNSHSSTNNNAPVWNSKSNYICWELYLGTLFKSKDVPYYAAPSRATNYRNLPPCTTFVGDLEPFKDEVIEYVERLKEADTPVKFELYKGCYHGFEQVCPNAKISKEAIAFMLSSYNYAVANYFAKQP